MNERVSGPSTAANPRTTPALQIPKVTMSRQPIYDAQHRIYAYVLSSQSDTSAPYGEEANSHNVQELIYYTFLETGVDRVTGPHRAVFRLTRGLLLMDYALVFSPDRVLLEIADFAPPDHELTEAVEELKAQGYYFVLNLPPHDPDDYHELMSRVHLLNIDLTLWSRPKLQDYISHCRQYPAQLLATNVDTSEDFEFCQTLGVDYFKGAFFGQADIITHRRSPINRPALLNLMTKLIDPATPFTELEDLVRCDVTLCHNLLRVLSSNALTHPEPITSVKQMLQTIGLKSLITWVSLILLSGLDDKPHELVTTAIIRAKMCKSLAKATRQKAPNTFFLTGLISVLDALLDVAMTDLTAHLSIDETIRRALLHCEGEQGRILGSVLAYESGNWEALNQLGIDSTVITDSYLRAIVWAEEATGSP